MSLIPASGVSRIAIATARLSSTTGIGVHPSNKSYRSAILAHSIHRRARLCVNRRNRRLQSAATEIPRRQTPFDQHDTFLHQFPLPERTILIFRQDQYSIRRHARLPA